MLTVSNYMYSLWFLSMASPVIPTIYSIVLHSTITWLVYYPQEAHLLIIVSEGIIHFPQRQNCYQICDLH